MQILTFIKVAQLPLEVRPYYSPVNPTLYPVLSVALLLSGFFFLAWFFMYVTIRFFERFKSPVGPGLDELGFINKIIKIRVFYALVRRFWVLNDPSYSNSELIYFPFPSRSISVDFGVFSQSDVNPSYELTTSDAVKRKKNLLYQELVIALISSFLLGWGTLYLLLWSGVYI